MRAAAGAWIASSVRARFPRLGAALGPQFDAMLATYFEREPDVRTSVRESGARLVGFLSASPDYPTWYAELAALDRAHLDVLHEQPATALLRRSDVTMDRTLKLTPAHALVEVASASDELWAALDSRPVSEPSWNRAPRELDVPQLVLVWSSDGSTVRRRTAAPDEAGPLRAARRETTLRELATLFSDAASPHARAVDVVLDWIDADLLAA